MKPLRDERNQLFFGDNLQVLRDSLGEASIDLIYLDRHSTERASTHLCPERRSSQFVASRATI